MAKKKISTVQIVDDGRGPMDAEAEQALNPDGVQVTPTPGELEQENDLSSFMESVGSDSSKVTIYRSDRLNPKPVYMGSVIPSMCTEDFIQSEFGEGRYVLRFLNSEGRHLTSKTVYIGPPSRAQVEKLNPPLVTHLDGGTQVQLELIKEQMKANQDLMLKLIESRGSGSGSGISDLTTIVDIVTKMVQPPPTAANLIADMVGVLKQGIELGASGGKPETSVLDLVGEGLKALPGIFAGLKKTPEAVPGKPVPGQAPPAQADGNDMLKQGINYLKNAVKRGHPVEHYIEAIVLNLDNPAYAIFLNCLDWPFEKFVEIDPEIAGPLYRTWFERLFVGLKDELSKSVDPDGADGHGGDAARNGSAGH